MNYTTKDYSNPLRLCESRPSQKEEMQQDQCYREAIRDVDVKCTELKWGSDEEQLDKDPNKG